MILYIFFFSSVVIVSVGVVAIFIKSHFFFYCIEAVRRASLSVFISLSDGVSALNSIFRFDVVSLSPFI